MDVFHKFLLLSNNISVKITQFNSTKAKLSNSQLNKLKSATKNEAGITLRLSTNMIGNTNDETNFLQLYIAKIAL